MYAEYTLLRDGKKIFVVGTNQPLCSQQPFVKPIHLFAELCVFLCFWRNTYTKRCGSTLGSFEYLVKQTMTLAIQLPVQSWFGGGSLICVFSFAFD